MKSKVLIFGLLITAVAVSLWCFKSPQQMDDLMLENVEALAAIEETVPLRCMGTGTVDCPLGGKVRRVAIGYSLEVSY